MKHGDRLDWAIATGMACAGFFFGQIPHCQETWRALVMLFATGIFTAMAFVKIRRGEHEIKRRQFAHVIGEGIDTTHATAVSRAKHTMIGSVVGSRVKNPNHYEVEALSVIRTEYKGEAVWDAVIVAKYELRHEE